jgi:hypothetical protein
MIKTRAYAALSPTTPVGPFEIERRKPGPGDGLEQYCENGFTGTYNGPAFGGENTFGGYSQTIAMDYIETAYARMLKSDVKYRFVIDMSTLR